MEQLFHGHLTRRQSLRVVMPHKGFQSPHIRLHAVGPVVLAHRLFRGLQLLFNEGQGDLGGGRVRQLVQCGSLGLFKRFDQRRRQPRVLRRQFLAQAHHMHDGGRRRCA